MELVEITCTDDIFVRRASRVELEPRIEDGKLILHSYHDYENGYNHQVILNDDDLTCVLVGYWFKIKKNHNGGGHFYRFYKNGSPIMWKALEESDRLRILDQELPYWANKPGKLKRDYWKPHQHSKIEKDNGGNIIAYKYLVWDEAMQIFKSFSHYARVKDWVDNCMSADELPREENTNGVYCAKTPNSPILSNYSKYPGVKLVRLLLSGVVLEYIHGYRAEHADILEVMS